MTKNKYKNQKTVDGISTKKEKVINSIKKGIEEFELMQSDKLIVPDFADMIHGLKADRDNRGSAGRGQGRKPSPNETYPQIQNKQPIYQPSNVNLYRQ